MLHCRSTYYLQSELAIDILEQDLTSKICFNIPLLPHLRPRIHRGYLQDPESRCETPEVPAGWGTHRMTDSEPEKGRPEGTGTEYRRDFSRQSMTSISYSHWHQTFKQNTSTKTLPTNKANEYQPQTCTTRLPRGAGVTQTSKTCDPCIHDAWPPIQGPNRSWTK